MNGKLAFATLLLFFVQAGFAQSRTARGQALLTLPNFPNAYGKLEIRDCPSHDAIGRAITPCEGANRLAGYSAGKSCISGVTYENGAEESALTTPLCVRDCTVAALSPKNDSCNLSTYKEYADTIAWRSTGALPGTTRERILALYRELIPLVEANAQDSRRTELKRAIVSLVVHEMIPLRYEIAMRKALDPAAPDNYHLPNLFWREGDSVEKFCPMEIRTDQELYIYESALLEKSGKGYRVRDPDDLALDLYHEMIHFLQQGFGYGESQFTFRSDMHAAQMHLFELMAYHTVLDSSYAKVLAKERHPLPNAIPGKLAVEFTRIWTDLSRDDQQYLARWAWSLPDGWMKSRMYTQPSADSSIWGLLCTANTGRGPCRMER